MTFPLRLPAIKLSARDIAPALLTGFGLALLGVWGAYATLGGPQAYLEPIVGGLALADQNKDREWLALNLLVGGTALLGLVLTLLFGRLRATGASEGYLAASRRMIVIAWVPAVFWLGVQYAVGNTPLFLPRMSGMFLLGILLVLGGLARFRREERDEEFFDAGMSACFAIGLMLFALVACMVVAGQASEHWRRALTTDWSLRAYRHASNACLLVLGAGAFGCTSVAQTRRRLYGLLLALQFPLPLLLLVYAESRFLYQGRELIMYRSPLLYVVLFALIAIAWFSLAGKLRTWLRHGFSSYESALSGWALFPVAAYFLWMFPWNLSIAVDDFHFGEQLLPWQQIVDFGKLPYVDFAPIHAGMPLLYAAVNGLFYGNTAATFPLAMSLVKALMGGIAFILVFRLLGPAPALLLIPLSYAHMTDRLHFLVPALLLLSLGKSVASARSWLIVWPAVCVTAVLHNNAVGAGVVLGSTPVALYMIWRESRGGGGWLAKWAATLLACAAVVLALPPLRDSALGMLQFVLENASTNTIANGSSMLENDLREMLGAIGISQFHSVLLRLSFMLVAFGALIFALRAGLDREEKRDRRVVVLAALVPITFLVIGKWLLNRAAPPGYILPREGNLGLLAFTIVVPLLSLGSGRFFSRPLLNYVLVFVIGALTALSGVHVDKKLLLTRPLQFPAISEAYTRFSGRQLGLPRLGEGFAPKEKIADIRAFRDAVQPFLKTGETFLDLTNRSALYFYLDKPVPVLYSSDYVAAGYRVQTKMLKQLREHPPPLVLIYPRLAWDGGPASLRSYLLYREVVDGYVPMEAGGFGFLVRRDRADPAPPREERARVLDAAFSMRRLSDIPNVWGRSWRLQSRYFREAGTLPIARVAHLTGGAGVFTPTAPGAQLWFDATRLGLTGNDVDYLLLEYGCDVVVGAPAPELKIYVGVEPEPLTNDPIFEFSGTGSRALIPVGASPRWRLAERLRTVRLDLVNDKSCSTLRVNRLEALKLVVPAAP